MSDFNYIAYQKEFETFKEDLHQQHVNVEVIKHG